MIARIEDLRPGRYWVRSKDSDHGWDELTIPHPPLPTDVSSYVLFHLKSHVDGRMCYGFIEIDQGMPFIYYPKMSAIPVEIRTMNKPEASISHVRRIEL